MNNHELEEYIPHLRIKSLRRRKRMIREAFDKKLLNLFRERKVLKKQVHNLGYEPLDPPVVRGWRRSFVLRQDVARSGDAKFFQGILDKINTTEYHWRKDFKVMKRSRGKKTYVVMPQKLQETWPQYIPDLKLTEKEKVHFDMAIIREPRSNHLVHKYVFNEPWRFVLKTEPNKITRTRIKNFDAEKRIAEIDKYIERDNLYPKVCRLMGGYQWRWRWIYTNELEKLYGNPLHNRSFTDILDEYWPEPEMKVEYRNPREAGGFLFEELRVSCALSILSEIDSILLNLVYNINLFMFDKSTVMKQENRTAQESLDIITSMVRDAPVFTLTGFGFKLNYQINPLIITLCATPTFLSGVIFEIQTVNGRGVYYSGCLALCR